MFIKKKYIQVYIIASNGIELFGAKYFFINKEVSYIASLITKKVMQQQNIIVRVEKNKYSDWSIIWLTFTIR